MIDPDFYKGEIERSYKISEALAEEREQIERSLDSIMPDDKCPENVIYLDLMTQLSNLDIRIKEHNLNASKLQKNQDGIDSHNSALLKSSNKEASSNP